MPEDIGGAGHGQAPILIKRKKVVAGGHHGGAWKVAYADMVTALMALFIVLWILSQSDEIVQSVAGYFRDPVGFKEGGVPSVVEGGLDAGQPTLIDDLSTTRASHAANPGSELDREADLWRERAARIEEALEKLPSFDRHRGQIELAVTPDGLRISLIESNHSQLFEIGRTELNPDGSEVLGTISRELAGLPNYIAIEGHTDSRPFAADSGMSNWELSTGRANAARRVLESA
ncbi:MAG: flagellar motor protein MotB, partial [Myxococcota bacterium]